MPRRRAALRPDAGTGALAADLPALRPGELGRALRAAARWPEAFVPDAAGSGTTLYTAAPGQQVPAQVRAAVEAAAPVARARPNSTSPALPACAGTWTPPADLGSAARLGLGPRTAAIAAELLPAARG